MDLKNSSHNFYEAGCYTLPEGNNLPYIWVSLHANAEMALLSETDRWASNDVRRFDDQISFLCRSLKTVSAARWIALCDAAGWTVFGAVALSWCKDGRLDQVWSGWLACGFPLDPNPACERPLTYLNPALIPQADSLSEIVAWVQKQEYRRQEVFDLACKALISCRQQGLVHDLDATVMAHAPPAVATFLNAKRPLSST
ncbi:hypothetical protein SAMN05877809_11259 [Rhodobacter sp. JA431]|uniref:hypothetical protein n=1 Tax=Rhodobacter sp. JA431 TaxID=570013 RepID=UPI000BDC09A9|nr:hypothetical protein [Rhodobacter sp. JA431]SOC20540.1 hypothetical protein SAMN05877809_11259 [Rhodobacter sp. JA431]